MRIDDIASVNDLSERLRNKGEYPFNREGSIDGAPALAVYIAMQIVTSSLAVEAFMLLPSRGIRR